MAEETGLRGLAGIADEAVALDEGRAGVEVCSEGSSAAKASLLDRSSPKSIRGSKGCAASASTAGSSKMPLPMPSPAIASAAEVCCPLAWPCDAKEEEVEEGFASRKKPGRVASSPPVPNIPGIGGGGESASPDDVACPAIELALSVVDMRGTLRCASSLPLC